MKRNKMLWDRCRLCQFENSKIASSLTTLTPFRLRNATCAKAIKCTDYVIKRAYKWAWTCCLASDTGWLGIPGHGLVCERSGVRGNHHDFRTHFPGRLAIELISALNTIIAHWYLQCYRPILWNTYLWTVYFYTSNRFMVNLIHPGHVTISPHVRGHCLADNLSGQITK